MKGENLGFGSEFNETEPVVKHRISGWIDTEVRSRKTTFEGHFTEYIPSYIKGELEDEHGRAIIIGRLTEGELSFRKDYLNGPSVGALIDYHYFASGNGKWKGQFFFEQYGVGWWGDSECETGVILKAKEDRP